jgi:hypothetical protein
MMIVNVFSVVAVGSTLPGIVVRLSVTRVISHSAVTSSVFGLCLLLRNVDCPIETL